MIVRAAAILMALTLAACATPRGPAPARDGPPAKPPENLSSIPDAVPQAEPLSARGNPDTYEVYGRRYHVLDSAAGYVEEGTASWYGRKFHGRPTSSGEPYDMYAMTAAHKTLPLPSYVRVTNLDNGREIVVRVNDRGPFHADRIIDLSYTAALQLDMVGHGTAPVRVEAIATGEGRADNDKGKDTELRTEPAADPALYLQAGAYADAENARDMVKKLEQLGVQRVFMRPTDGEPPMFRVRIGPYDNKDALASDRSRLAKRGIDVRTLRE